MSTILLVELRQLIQHPDPHRPNIAMLRPNHGLLIQSERGISVRWAESDVCTFVPWANVAAVSCTAEPEPRPSLAVAEEKPKARARALVKQELNQAPITSAVA